MGKRKVCVIFLSQVLFSSFQNTKGVREFEKKMFLEKLSLCPGYDEPSSMLSLTCIGTHCCLIYIQGSQSNKPKRLGKETTAISLYLLTSD